MAYNQLNEEEKRVIIHKGTQRAFTGKYTDTTQSGIYICKQCNQELYKSTSKFHSGCGWPSFDDEISGAVKRVIDADGRRVEIICSNCGGHLGHVFEGEGFTPKNTRHCVNSISMIFVPDKKKDEENTKNTYFAAGCFWGVEYHFQQKAGVVSAQSGYMGGFVKNPTYQQVCYTKTGHLEVVKVTYDSSKVTFEELAKLFFEIHDPSQADGQGPDIGEQYLSAIFYNDSNEKEIAKKLIDILEDKNIKVVTNLIDANQHKFYIAEDYHQDYYFKTGKTPYCHTYEKKF
jgi:peptide methionine sulfoxide reductase msrA/msrB